MQHGRPARAASGLLGLLPRQEAAARVAEKRRRARAPPPSIDDLCVRQQQPEQGREPHGGVTSCHNAAVTTGAHQLQLGTVCKLRDEAINRRKRTGRTALAA